MKRFLQAALFCGAAPLVVGIAIFVAWIFTRAGWLMVAGVFTIYAGLCSVGIGAICLVVYVWRSWRSGEIKHRSLVWQAVGTAALLLANFPAGVSVVMGAILIETRYTVTLTNQSDVPLKSAEVCGGGVDVRFGDVAPGATVVRSFWIKADGELVLTAIHGSNKVETTVEGYVTNGMGGDKIVVLDANGSVNIKDKHPRSPD